MVHAYMLSIRMHLHFMASHTCSSHYQHTCCHAHPAHKSLHAQQTMQLMNAHLKSVTCSSNNKMPAHNSQF